MAWASLSLVGRNSTSSSARQPPAWTSHSSCSAASSSVSVAVSCSRSPSTARTCCPFERSAFLFLPRLHRQTTQHWPQTVHAIHVQLKSICVPCTTAMVAGTQDTPFLECIRSPAVSTPSSLVQLARSCYPRWRPDHLRLFSSSSFSFSSTFSSPEPAFPLSRQTVLSHNRRRYRRSRRRPSPTCDSHSRQPCQFVPFRILLPQISFTLRYQPFQPFP